MDGRRFDEATRLVARGASRRSLLGRAAALVAGLAIGRAASAPSVAEAHHCDFSGCGCRVGTAHGCGGGLICCAFPSIVGQAGTCLPADACGQQCRGAGSVCTDTCDAGEHCLYCCSDVCDYDGTCR